MMRKLFMPLAGLAAACAAPASAASPALDPASIEMPVLAFTPDSEAEKNYDKYFYFHREGTDFATALSDIHECDGYARGLSYSAGGVTPYVPYGGMLGGAIGGAIGSAMADAIFGSAERRKQRRMNLRTCMGFKEYKAYGLPKELWTGFNFEEGLTAVDDARREALLLIQAKVASGPKPTVGEILQ
jgi:hypothetical protein